MFANNVFHLFMWLYAYFFLSCLQDSETSDVFFFLRCSWKALNFLFFFVHKYSDFWFRVLSKCSGLTTIWEQHLMVLWAFLCICLIFSNSLVLFLYESWNKVWSFLCMNLFFGFFLYYKIWVSRWFKNYVMAVYYPCALSFVFSLLQMRPPLF